MTDPIAFIGGTGVYSLDLADQLKPLQVKTNYGEVQLQEGHSHNRKIYFMARHGGNHGVAPHEINYRANISALRWLGVQNVVSTAAVGSLQKGMFPGSMVVIDQFIDFTKSRASTFFSGPDQPVVHTDFSNPYCPSLRSTILKKGKQQQLPMIDGGTYVCTEGPRFETPAEINMFHRWGGDLVGMTNVPEVVLAREAGLCYATVALVTNYAAGISSHPLTHDEVVEVMEAKKDEVNQLFSALIEEALPSSQCLCSSFGQHFQVAGEFANASGKGE